MLHDDAQQQQIIELSDTTALVLAGPGCGKTHILARRVFHASAHTDFDEMLCVTFTNRAAREMKQRIEAYMGYVPQNLFVGNMHRFCLRFLYENEIVNADTTVIDEEDRLDFLVTILDRPTAANVNDFLTKAAYVYQVEHDHPDHIIRRPASPLTEADYQAIDAYSRFKTENRLIDYDDILLQTYTALQQLPAADFKMTAYRWVQVDEVQDMTPLQLAIVDAVTMSIRRTLIYFGDEQQAIFRFIGAGGRALDLLKRQCRGNILRLKRNYRSPGYLVEMCNTLACDWLDINRQFLPEAVDNSRDEGNMTLYSASYEQLAYTAANIARLRLAESPDENVAVLCRVNTDAEYLSEVFCNLGLSHFHVSKQDLFHQLPFKTVWSHLAAVSRPFMRQPWVRLLYQTRCAKTVTGARKLVSLLRNSAIGCDELLYFDKPLRVERLIELYGSDTEIVVFDTETTGLDILNDDIVQIAAVKILRGEIIGQFEVFISSDRRLPRELQPGVLNPIAEIYKTAQKLKPTEAFAAFEDFIQNAILAGHNLDFDIAIMRRNISRRTNADIPWQLTPAAERLDTLVLARQLYPQLHRHRLKDMIEVLKLEACNSHNAVDDTLATASLLAALFNKAEKIKEKVELAHKNESICRCAKSFRAAYGDFYFKWRSMLHNPDESYANSLCGAISEANEFFKKRGYCDGIQRLDYVLALIERCIIDQDDSAAFGPQIARHLHDMLSFNESDFFSNGIVDERLSIMTIHKAKGLEMDNVIVFDASRFYGDVTDHARVLYVAFSRARRRLAVGLSGNMPPPMRGLQQYFRRMTPAQVKIAVNCEYLNLK